MSKKWDGLKHYFKQNLKTLQSWNGVEVFGFENGSFYTLTLKLNQANGKTIGQVVEHRIKGD